MGDRCARLERSSAPREAAALLAATVWVAAAPWGARAAPPGATAAGEGVVEGSVTLLDPDGAARDDRGGVIVALEGLPRGEGPRPTTTLRQQGKRFTPPLAVVVRGDTVTFPNEDSIFHNVFSLSAAARFDLGLYRSGATKEVVFEKVGVVDVYCNIHPEMAAKIVVVDSPQFVVTRADGRFRLDRLPPGRWTLAVTHPSGAVERRAVEVTSGGTAAVTVELRERPTRRRHLRKDGSAYGRYE
jgi:plastocyanin